MTKKLIYTDKAGNKLYEHISSSLIILNPQGKQIKPTHVKPFIKQPVVKNAINNFYNLKKVNSSTKPKFKTKL